jgi:hypothetical protein
MGGFVSDKDKMLGGDKSLKTYLEKETVLMMKKKTDIRTSFEENKEKLEAFYKTNIEDIIEGKSKLAEARERFRFKKQEYCVNKELSYEMDPFKWDLVKDINGKTKVRIIEELEDKNNIPDEEIMPDEETLSIENKKPLMNLEKQVSCYRELLTFEERKTNIEEYFKNNFDWWLSGNRSIQTI